MVAPLRATTLPNSPRAERTPAPADPDRYSHAATFCRRAEASSLAADPDCLVYLVVLPTRGRAVAAHPPPRRELHPSRAGLI